MKTDTTYNGWTNRATWTLNLQYEETFANMAEEQEWDSTEDLAEAFEMLVDELEFRDLRENSLAWQALGDLLNAVNWEELAERFFVDDVSEEV